MSIQVETALRVLRVVAERPDPTSPIGSGEIAREAGIGPSRSSRTCAELDRHGLLTRGGPYGTYRLGPAAIRLSGRAAAPVARSVRHALIVASQYTGETACLAARAGESLTLTAAVGSEWTLHASADVGESVAEGSAIATAACDVVATGADPSRVFETRRGRVVEVATPVLGPDGRSVAVVAIRLPSNRATRGVPRAHRAVRAARHRIEAMIAMQGESEAQASAPPSVARPVTEPAPTEPAPAEPPLTEPALAAALRILDHLTDGARSRSDVARSTGLRLDRVSRLLDACLRAGVVETGDDGRVDLGWSVHGWHRAVAGPVIGSAGREIVAETASHLGVYGFITVLRGIRSFTVVEELGEPDAGVSMMPWLGRPHPVIGSDGGPTLVMEFDPVDLRGLLGSRHSALELDRLLDRAQHVARHGVISIDSDQDAGLVSTSAPIRDASGSVVAAACLTRTTDSVRHRRVDIEQATRDLADRVSALLS